MKQLNKAQISIGILIIFHLVGIGGVLFGNPSEFLMLTPLNLLLTLVLLLINHPKQRRNWVFVVIYLAGFLVEMLGVNTGFPFGTYAYGPVLGPKLFETPLMIGVNWLILLYGANAITDQFGLTHVVKAIAAGGLMVLLDFFIEPVAIHYNFWQWESPNPPLSNYLAWFAIAVILSLFLRLSEVKLNLKIGRIVFIIEFVFFLALSLNSRL